MAWPWRPGRISQAAAPETVPMLHVAVRSRRHQTTTPTRPAPGPRVKGGADMPGRAACGKGALANLPPGCSPGCPPGCPAGCPPRRGRAPRRSGPRAVCRGARNDHSCTRSLPPSHHHAVTRLRSRAVAQSLAAWRRRTPSPFCPPPTTSPCWRKWAKGESLVRHPPDAPWANRGAPAVFGCLIAVIGRPTQRATAQHEVGDPLLTAPRLRQAQYGSYRPQQEEVRGTVRWVLAGGGRRPAACHWHRHWHWHRLQLLVMCARICRRLGRVRIRSSMRAPQPRGSCGAPLFNRATLEKRRKSERKAKGSV